MRNIQSWLDEYGESHQNEKNKLIHWICVPSIMFSLFGILWNVSFGLGILPEAYASWENLATVLFISALLFYILQSISLALGMFLIAGAMLLIVSYLDTLGNNVLLFTSIGVFVVAWIGQFIGHKIEGKKPSFFKDVQFLLIGPAWLLSFVYAKLGIRY